MTIQWPIVGLMTCAVVHARTNAPATNTVPRKAENVKELKVEDVKMETGAVAEAGICSR